MFDLPQWECKTDMDNAFRLGEVTVICEGFDYPDDPYILKGSCGLEYTLDYTMEGKQSSNINMNRLCKTKSIKPSGVECSAKYF